MIRTIDVSYPTYVRWRLDIGDEKNPLFSFRTRTQQRIKRAKRKLEAAGYQFTIEPATSSFIDRFEPLYKEFIQSIKGKLRPVRTRILTKPPHSFPYYAISLYMKDNLIGAVIFSDKEDHISTAYRVVPHTLSVKLPISVSYVFEFLLNEYCITRSYRYLTHGADRNNFGKTHTIGLANYKLLIGCKPFIPERKKGLARKTSFQWDGVRDICIFLWPTKGTRITDAYYLSASGEHTARLKYPQLFETSSPKIRFIHP